MKLRRIAAAFAVCILFSTLIALGEPPPTRPNVLVILADDLGYGDLACYGAHDLRTPHIDSLVSAGMRFDSFYANSTVCSPSRAALLSGRYPELVGVPGVIRTRPEENWGFLAPGAVLQPAVLQPAGYHTAIVGKWHLGLESPNTPNDRGFDHFHGFLGDMMEDYLTHVREGQNYMRLNRDVINTPGHATELFTQWAIDYLHERAAAKDGKPFYLYLAYNAPHIPIQPPKQWLDRVIAREPGITPKRAKIVALIEHLDDGIGKVLAELKALGMDQNTLVIFTSDNGGDLPAGAHNGDLRDGKGSMYEGGLRVPMCAVWPGHIALGSHGPVAAMHMDLLPTICEAAAVKPPPHVDGVSLLPVLQGAPAGPQFSTRPLFFLRREGGIQYDGLTIYAVRRGDWKLLQNTPFKGQELYNVAEDPRETRDVATEYPKIRRELSTLMLLQAQRGGAVPWQKPDIAFIPAQDRVIGKR